MFLLFNQQQILMLFLAAGTQIHDEVKLFFTKQRILLFDLQFLPTFNIFNLERYFENYVPPDWMKKDLELTSMSALWNLHRIFILFVVFIQAIVLIINMAFGLKLNEERKEQEERKTC